MSKIRLWIGLAVICLGLAWPYIEDANILPSEPSVREVLNIERPNDELLSTVEKYDNILTDEDRDKLSIFCYEFAKRSPDYQIDSQTFLNLHSSAFRNAFDDQFNNKYKDLDSLLGDKAVKEILGNKEVFITKEKANDVSERINAAAWVLGDDK